MRPFTASKQKTTFKNQRDILLSQSTQRPTSAIFSLRKITELIESKLNLNEKLDKKSQMQMRKSINKVEPNMINLDKMLTNGRRKTKNNSKSYQTQIIKKQQKPKNTFQAIRASKKAQNTFEVLFKSQMLKPSEYPLKYRSQNIIRDDFVPYNKSEENAKPKYKLINPKLINNQNDGVKKDIFNNTQGKTGFKRKQSIKYKQGLKKSLKSIQEKSQQLKNEEITSWETNQSFMKMSKIMGKFAF